MDCQKEERAAFNVKHAFITGAVKPRLLQLSQKPRNAYHLMNPLKLLSLLRSALYHAYLLKLVGKKYTGLHLGCGSLRIKGFCNIDANVFAPCDIISGIYRLKLRSQCTRVIYASHVFEHVPHAMAAKVLSEWYSLAWPDGKLYLLVPDLEALCKIYLENLPQYESQDGRHKADLAMRIMYGGQINAYDFHFQGFSFTTLKALLQSIGFKDVKRFNRESITFCPFRDAGYAAIMGTPISLNVVATK